MTVLAILSLGCFSLFIVTYSSSHKPFDSIDALASSAQLFSQPLVHLWNRKDYVMNCIHGNKVKPIQEHNSEEFKLVNETTAEDLHLCHIGASEDGMLVFQQIKGIPMGSNCSPLLADLYLTWLEYDFMQVLHKNDKALAPIN